MYEAKIIWILYTTVISLRATCICSNTTTVNSRYIGAGYNEIPAYSEM